MKQEEKKLIDSNTESNLKLLVFYNVSKFKSLNRAFKRGHITYWGELIPKRPFNNKKRTLGRKLQIEKERIYGNIKLA